MSQYLPQQPPNNDQPPYMQPQHYQQSYSYQQPPQQPFYTYPRNYQYPEPGIMLQQPSRSISRTSITLSTLFVLALLLTGSIITYLHRVSATQSGTWTATHTFTGNSNTQTALFTVATDWKLVYSCDGSISGQDVSTSLGVFVYDSNANPLDAAVNAQCAAGQITT